MSVKDMKKGEIIFLSSEEHSDYCVEGVFVVNKDFSPDLSLSEWRESHDGHVNIRNSSRDKLHYIAWLQEIGYIVDLKATEIHTGSYGETKLTQYN